MVVGLHADCHHPHDSLWQHVAHRFGVRPSLLALHLELLPGVSVPVRPHGGPCGHAASHAQRAVWGLGAVARLLPHLALLRCYVLQRVHPQPVCDQLGSVPLHHLAAALQAEDDPTAGVAPGRGRLGAGGTDFLPAHSDEMAQLRPLEWTLTRPRGQR